MQLYTEVASFESASVFAQFSLPLEFFYNDVSIQCLDMGSTRTAVVSAA